MTALFLAVQIHTFDQLSSLAVPIECLFLSPYCIPCPLPLWSTGSCHSATASDRFSCIVFGPIPSSLAQILRALFQISMRALRLCLIVTLLAFWTCTMKRNQPNNQNPTQRAASKQQRRSTNQNRVENNQPTENESQQQQNVLDQFNMNYGYERNAFLPTMPTHPYNYHTQQFMPPIGDSKFNPLSLSTQCLLL